MRPHGAPPPHLTASGSAVMQSRWPSQTPHHQSIKRGCLGRQAAFTGPSVLKQTRATGHVQFFVTRSGCLACRGAAAGTPPFPRKVYGMVAADQLYIFGGRTKMAGKDLNFNDVYAFDPDAGSWSQVQFRTLYKVYTNKHPSFLVVQQW